MAGDRQGFMGDNSMCNHTVDCDCSVCQEFNRCLGPENLEWFAGEHPKPTQEEGSMSDDKLYEAAMEKERRRTEEGTRNSFRTVKEEKSQEKVPFADMLSDFHLALTEVARVTSFGNQKYGEPGGWRKVEGFQRSYQNKKARHAMEGLLQDFDGESGLFCLAHEAWNALALLQDKLEKIEGDKRRSSR